MKNTSIIIVVVFMLFACTENKRNRTYNNENSVISVKENTKKKKKPKTFDLNKDKIYLKKMPQKNADNIINEKATKALGTVDYITVDRSRKVVILEQKDQWSKIKVVDPDWLSETHKGWILSKHIIMENKVLEKLPPKTYEILKTEEMPTVITYHILIKLKKYNEEKIYDFIQRFRNEYCTDDKCNVMIYDSKSILNLINKKPLEGKDYIKLADHFVSMSSFDSPNSQMWYPFQDFLYKEYGGKNWKKKKIE